MNLTETMNGVWPGLCETTRQQECTAPLRRAVWRRGGRGGPSESLDAARFGRGGGGGAGGFRESSRKFNERRLNHCLCNPLSVLTRCFERQRRETIAPLHRVSRSWTCRARPDLSAGRHGWNGNDARAHGGIGKWGSEPPSPD